MLTRGIDEGVWRQQAWFNRLQSLLLLAFMGGFLALLGWLLWGGGGIVMLLSGGVISLLFDPTFSPRLVMQLYGASSIGPHQVPALWAVLSRLSKRAELPMMPQLYYVPSRMLNAFAVGTREQVAIAVTDGLLRQLNRRELAGVLAHEISHVRNDDLWVMGLADMLSRATNLMSLLGQFLLVLNLPLALFSDASINWVVIALLVFASNLSALAQLALSRNREYNADLNAARLTGDPVGLARALTKMEHAQGGWWERIFMPGRRVPGPSLLRTHPKTQDRIARLMVLKPAKALLNDLSGSGVFELPPAFGRPVIRPPRWHINGLWH